ncbi:S-adenosyl-L-methionine-dependent methyltransferase [Aspergillus egyptiacus]|nr:S-adenosyl-L-methionine-dependent methyltransferase [Aspergillus egyptiacus]
MRDRCMLSLTKPQVHQAGSYCSNHSTSLPQSIEEQLRRTDALSSAESIMAPSPAQCAWLMGFARALNPARVLELGTFTGVSTLSFYEGTRRRRAEITTVDLSEMYLRIAEEAFRRYDAMDRIRVVRGDCLEVLPTLPGPFDLIYIDAAEEEYKAYVRVILENRLLAPEGVMLVDDVLLEGLVVDGQSIVKQFPPEIQQPYLRVAEQMEEFNSWIVRDQRVEVTMVPVFNGISMIMWK